ncbi:MAG: hypothetical protein U9R24_07190 [Thermodesulfobacteriota bacterium]|nr:hypothetical protein [Thermodesulfobacteriota bacterium]
MNIETPSVKQTNANFVRKIYQSPDLLKEAMDNSTYFIRDKVRELGFARKLVEPIFVTSADLDRTVENDQPTIILEKDMDAKAYTLPFRGKGESKYWEGENFLITFQKLESDRFNKSKFEMMNSKTDYKTLLQKRIVEEMFYAEDETMIAAFDGIITDAEAAAPGTQYQVVTGGLTKSNIKLLMQMMSKLRMLPTKDGPKPKFLMNLTLKMELVELGMLEIGDSSVGKYWNEGTIGVENLFGVPIVSTIKDDLVKDDEMYIIAPQDYFGRFFILQDHTMVIKTEADMIEFWSYGSFGLGFANAKGVAKIKFS